MRLSPTDNQRGSFLASAIITTSAFMFIALAMSAYALNHYHLAVRGVPSSSALLAAQAGAQIAINELDKSLTYSGTGGDCATTGFVDVYNDSTHGRARYCVAVTNGTATNTPGTEKIITVTGKTYAYNTTSPAQTTRTIKVTGHVTPNYPYVVQTGPGALSTQNNARIEGSSSARIRAKGSIDVGGNSIIGPSSYVDEVWAADYGCPLAGGSTFPTLCASSTQKAIAEASSANFFAEQFYVPGSGYTSGSPILESSTRTGNANTDPAYELPGDNRASIKSNVGTNGSALSCSSGTPAGLIWPAANETYKISGNVTLSGTCTLTVKSNLWITGRLVVSNTATVVVDNALTGAPTIMVDGVNASNEDSISLQNSSDIVQNSSGIGAIFIASWNNTNLDGTISGDSLFNHSDNRLIEIDTNSTIDGSVFYARWGRVTLRDFLGNGSPRVNGALVGQSMNISHASVVAEGANLGTNSGSEFTVTSYKEL